MLALRILSDIPTRVMMLLSLELRRIRYYTQKKGVSVSFVDWNGDIPAYSEMEEIWVKVEGIPPKYLSWRVMMRVAMSPGIPIDVE
jgi:hypothetical protein